MRIELACCVAALLSTAATAAQNRCPSLIAAFGSRLADVNCFESPDLTTNNPAVGLTATTPANNSLSGLPPFAFTPITDRGVISPNPPNRTAIAKAVPGVQLNAQFADDPTGQGRFLLRLPDNWNGGLVV